MTSPGAFEVVTFGESMMLLTPVEPGSLEAVGEFRSSIAGAESNLAIGLARLGHSVAWVSRLGRDPFGAKVLKTVRGEGVNVDRVELDDELPTGLMFKEQLGHATNVYYYRKSSAASQLSLDQFRGLSARILFVSGITPGLSENNRDCVLAAVRKFKEAGAEIVFDPNLRLKLWQAAYARKVFRQITSLSDLVLPSLAEAELIASKGSVEEMADELLALGPGRVAIKAGKQGAYYRQGLSGEWIPPFPVREVDPIGAGDAFCAGVLSGLLDGLPFAEAVRRGCATGALAVTCHGDFGGLPTRTQLEAFLQNRKPVER
jgi:2-dehydro-3-deoxygluconokinase